MSELEIFNHEEPGYKPLIDYSTWRVALLNSPSMYLPENVTYYDRHLETDEVFILLSGSLGTGLLVSTSGRENQSLTDLSEKEYGKRVLKRKTNRFLWPTRSTLMIF